MDNNNNRHTAAFASTTTTTTNSNNNSIRLDRPIKATADDAILAKLATTQAGYYSDPFLDAFSQGSVGISVGCGGGCGGSDDHRGVGRRRTIQPIIKRGTHARVCVMDRAVSAFLRICQEGHDVVVGDDNHNSWCQIVVLGAGKDTTYFRYLNKNIMGMDDATKIMPSNSQDKQQQQQQQPHVHWYDVDHVSVVQEKASLIRRSNLLSNFCPDLTEKENDVPGQYYCTGDGSNKSSYHLVGQDLRDPPALLLAKLDLDVRLPTLFLMECVSMYVPVDSNKSLLQALSTACDRVWIVCYEPILGDSSQDPFGRVMEQNLVRAGVAWPESCLLQTRTLRQQLEKLVHSAGFRRAVGCDMWSAYETVVTDAQRKRANQSEFLDEYEEWVLIMRHYCFIAACGGRSSNNTGRSTSDLTWVGKERNSSPLGFMTGKCIELEQD